MALFHVELSKALLVGISRRLVRSIVVCNLYLPHCRYGSISLDAKANAIPSYGGYLLNCSVPAVSRLRVFSIMPYPDHQRTHISSIHCRPYKVLLATSIVQLIVDNLHPLRFVCGMNLRSLGRNSQSKHFGQIGL